MPVLVGTSGWQYRHWRGAFYPAGVPQRRWLEYYAARFATVENNGTFYRLPARETFEQWRARTPEGFVMAVKASRYLTHIRRLRDPAEPVRRMLDAFAGLGGRLGPVLIQLPPDMRADPELLDRALGQFPPGVRVAVEPRHPSWWSDPVRDVLVARGAALCWADRAGQPVTPLWRTADWGYVRFHEGPVSRESPVPPESPVPGEAQFPRKALATRGPGTPTAACGSGPLASAAPGRARPVSTRTSTTTRPAPRSSTRPPSPA